MLAFALLLLAADPPDARGAYWICVTNERSGDVTLIDGATRQTAATVSIGKRPRGVHASPDGKRLYVAVSGSPITGPPKLDAQGKPIFEPEREEDSDRSADGIAVVDLDAKKFLKKLPAGVDPEEFAVSRDGKRIYVANEDVATMSVVRVEDGTIERIVRVQKEPEGVALTPDGKHVYVTCETGGEVVVVSTATHKRIAEIPVGGRPRTVAFTTDGARAFIPSETTGRITTVDAVHHKVTRVDKLPEGSRPMGTLLSKDGSKLFVSTGRAGTICVLEINGMKSVATIKVGDRPWGMDLSPDGETLFVANGPSNDVSVVDVSTLHEVRRIHAGKSPWGLRVVAR